MTCDKYENTFNHLVERIETEPQCAPNGDYCRRFVETCHATGLTVHTRNKYLSKVVVISGIVPGKDFKQWTREDVEKVMKYLHATSRPWTISTYVAFFKHFWRFIFDLASSDTPPEAVRWLHRQTPESELRKEDLLTREEIQAMIDSTKNIEQKALIAILAAGPRPREVRSIRLGDIHDQGSILKIYVQEKPVQGKKNKVRPIYPGIGFINKPAYADYVRQLVVQHPRRGDLGAPLFPTLTPGWLRLIVLTLGARAGLVRLDGQNRMMGGKPLKPYLFRHTYGTWAYSSHNTSYARRLMGHSANSEMEAVYCHLGEEDIEDVLLGRTKREKPRDIETEEAFDQKWVTFLSEKRNQLMQDFVAWMKEQG